MREGHCQALRLIRAELEICEGELYEIRKVWQCFHEAFKIIGRPVRPAVINPGGLGQQGIRIDVLAPHEVHVLLAIGEQGDAIVFRDLVQLLKLLVEDARLERRSLEISLLADECQ